jgi:glycosyltransferase involved in cell wall biosynthesis
VVDDGSTDGSAEIIQSFGNRITFERATNSGSNATRNRLTSLARGDWLQYLDADDYLLPAKLESQVEVIREKSGELDVVYSPIIVREGGTPDREYQTVLNGEDDAENFIRWIPFNTHGMMLRREVVLAVGGWKEDQPCCQEHELLLRIFCRGARFGIGKSAGAVYRRLSSNTISSKNPLRVIRIRMGLTDRLEEHLRARGELRASHRTALFVARLESARSAFQWDESVAEALAKKALANGNRFAVLSPALSLGYRLALSMFGFKWAERLASGIRRRKHVERTRA